MSLCTSSVLWFTWQSPVPPPPRVGVCPPGWAVYCLKAPPLECVAHVPRTVRSSPRRNRSSRNPGGSGGRWRWLAQGAWWGAGPEGPGPSRLSHWCVTPWVRNCMCYCHSWPSSWNPGPVSACSRTSWFQPGPEEARGSFNNPITQHQQVIIMR